MHKLLDKKYLQYAGPVILVLVLGAVFLYPKFKHSDAPKGRQISAKQVSAMAQQVYDECATVPYRPTCYEDKIPALMDTVSMEDAFEVARVVQDMDRSFTYCHVLGHKLAARETARDPSQWKEVVGRSPAGLCSNGGIHGAFQERFRTESLSDEDIEEYKPDFMDICEAKENWHPTGLQQASCYHALGHLMMYITDADVQKSTNLCEEIGLKDDGKRDYRQLCYDGAFMQIFQPLEPEDFALVEGKVPTKAEMTKFCSPYTGLKRGPCWNESWPLSRAEILQPSGLVHFCSQFLTAIADLDRCYSAMFYVITAQMQFDTTKMAAFCEGLPASREGQCFANAASRMIETDYRNITASIELCEHVTNTRAQKQCYEELLLYSTYNFQPGSTEFFALCDALPGDWSKQCLAKYPGSR